MFIYHPLIFSVFPILYLFSYNVGQAHFSVIIVPLLISLIAAGGLWIVLGHLLKDRGKAGLLVSLYSFLFYSYGHVYIIGKDLAWLGINLSQHRYLLVLWLIIFCLGTWGIVKTKRDLGHLHQFLNTVAVALVIFCFISVGYHEIRVNKHKVQTFKELQPADADTILPDIYYIVLDGYGNQEVLSDLHGFDNQSMMSYLRSKGFYVANKSRSNYATSGASIKSSLNMRYLDPGEETGHATSDSAVVHQFKKQGYKIINFPSGYEVTSPLDEADREIHCGGISEFNITLIEATLLSSLKDKLHVLDYVEHHAKRILCTFEQVPQISKEYNQPVFVFAHIVCPHPPYLFDQTGLISQNKRAQEFEPTDTFVATNKNWSSEYKAHYINQLQFVNAKVKVMIEDILASSKDSAIIVLQSDHGPAFSRFEYAVQGEESIVNREIVRERLRNLNAYYLPKEGQKYLYDTMTPINTFRLIFNLLFDAHYELLEDRVYWTNFQDVTALTLP